LAPFQLHLGFQIEIGPLSAFPDELHGSGCRCADDGAAFYAPDFRVAYPVFQALQIEDSYPSVVTVKMRWDPAG